MKRFLIPLAVPLMFPALAEAETYMVCDFDNYEIGREIPMWNRYGAQPAGTAKVVADPTNSLNKVLLVELKDWNDYPEFVLPAEYAGTALTGKFTTVKFDFCRAGGENYKQMHVFLGDDMLYGDSNYLDQGPEGQWSSRSYALGAVPAGNTSDRLRLGLGSNATSFYIDNIKLSGAHDDYVIYENGVLDFCDMGSTSSSYTSFSTPINIPQGKELKVYTSRYSYWNSDIIGSGRLNIYSGGERMYLGTAKAEAYPDWTEFDGEVHVYPHEAVTASGSYGIMLCAGKKKFAPEDIRTSIMAGDYVPILQNNNVTLHAGASFTVEVAAKTARAFRIGRLATEKGSTLSGHYKNKEGYRSYYIVGGSNTDSELAGKIAPTGSSVVGIIKEGSGTYRITGNDNNITGTLSVLGGKVLIMNDAEAAKAGRLSGATGVSSNDITAVAVYYGGELGGTGNIAGLTDVHGVVEPGTDRPGTLLLADYAKGTPVDLRLRPTGRLRFKINASDSYDRLSVAGNVCYDNRGEDLQPSEKTPILEIKLPFKHSLKVGDRFTLLQAAGRTSVDNVEWAYRIQYPKAYTWKVEEINDASGYSVVAEVTSLEYTGQGDTIYDDGGGDEKTDNSDYLVDYNQDFTDPTPMREYAARASKGIGVAVPVWKGYLDQSDKASLISSNFNMVVAENCMKFDAIHPSRNSYSFGGPDGLVDFAARNGMAVRGHTLVWHSQLAKWVSEDGYKNNHNFNRQQLLDIMKEHIDKVVGRYKGKVREWDVVNECLDDDQSVVWGDRNAYNLRKSVWQQVIGEDFIAKAFEYAHAADPDAVLYLNDYGVEFMGQPKAEAFFNLAKSLVEKGVPIHGVGLQCHLTVGDLKAERLVANIRRFEEIGLKCIVTELDIAQTGGQDAEERQAIEYCELVNAALSEPNCPTVMVWGMFDNDSWRQGNPLLFNSSMQPKEAFYAVHGVLRHLASHSGIDDITDSEAEIVAREYYNIQGMRVANPAAGIYICRTVYSDGTVRTAKQLIR